MNTANLQSTNKQRFSPPSREAAGKPPKSASSLGSANLAAQTVCLSPEPTRRPGEWGTPDQLITATPDRPVANGHPETMSEIPKLPAGTESACLSASDPVSSSTVCTPCASEGIQFPTETEINRFFDHSCWKFFRHQCWGKGESSGFSASDFQESFLRFHRESKIDKSQAFKMHILMDFMMGVEKTDKGFDRQQVLDLSLLKDQDGQLKLLLFSNIDSPLLSNLCGIISDQYGIPVEYPQLDPKNYCLNNKNELIKNKSISVDSKRKLPGEASVKILTQNDMNQVLMR